jgi:hypothetical protein
VVSIYHHIIRGISGPLYYKGYQCTIILSVYHYIISVPLYYQGYQCIIKLSMISIDHLFCAYSIWAVKWYWLDKHFAIYGQWTRDSMFFCHYIYTVYHSMFTFWFTIVPLFKRFPCRKPWGIEINFFLRYPSERSDAWLCRYNEMHNSSPGRHWNETFVFGECHVKDPE